MPFWLRSQILFSTLAVFSKDYYRSSLKFSVILLCLSKYLYQRLWLRFLKILFLGLAGFPRTFTDLLWNFRWLYPVSLSIFTKDFCWGSWKFYSYDWQFFRELLTIVFEINTIAMLVLRLESHCHIPALMYSPVFPYRCPPEVTNMDFLKI